MEFTITKSSEWISEIKPCKNAELIKNEKQYKEWKIEINTLEELIQLMKDVDEPLVIQNRFYMFGKPQDGIELEIEIYDGYRE